MTAEYKSKLEKKEPCKYCGGPYGECKEIRGGHLPEVVCKKKPTYNDLWKRNQILTEEYEGYNQLQKDYDLLLEDLTDNIEVYQEDDEIVKMLTHVADVDIKNNEQESQIEALTKENEKLQEECRTVWMFANKIVDAMKSLREIAETVKKKLDKSYQ